MTDESAIRRSERPPTPNNGKVACAMEGKRGPMATVLGVLTAGLVLAWSLPHSIAGRLWGAALVGALAVWLWKAGKGVRLAAAHEVRVPLRRIVVLLVAMTVWLGVQPWVIFDGMSKPEIGSQWLLPLWFGACGFTIAILVEPVPGATARRATLRAAVYTMAAVTVLNTSNALWYWIDTATISLPLRPWLYDGPFQFKVFCSQIALYLFVLCASDLLCRRFACDAMPGVSARQSAMLLLIGMSGILVTLSRNAIIVWSVCCALLLLFAITGSQRTAMPMRRRGWLAAIAAVATMLVLGLSLDERWSVTLDGLGHAWSNFDKDLSWVRNAERSTTLAAQGIERGEVSAYERMTYAMLGARLIAANPLGVGFRRSAFSDAMAKTFGPGDYLNAHSGVIEFGVGAGIPGLILLALICAGLSHAAWRAWSNRPSWPAAALILVLAAYILRGIVDNTMRNQFVEMAVFLLGFLLGAVMHERSAASEQAPTDD